MAFSCSLFSLLRVFLSSYIRRLERIRDEEHHKGEVLGGLTLAEIAYDKSTHVATFIEKDNNNDYFVQFIPDDKNNRYNIYVNDEICGVLPYEIIKNCSEEKIAEKFADARKSTIEEYKRGHQ